MTEAIRFEVRVLRGSNLILQCVGRIDNVLKFDCTGTPIIDTETGVLLKGFVLIPHVRELPPPLPRA